jgi:hypothetical protein
MNEEMDRLAAWLTRQSPKRLGYLGRLRYAGMPEERLGPIAWALYRRQYGLEARALVALVMAPPEMLGEARGSLHLRQLLTPAYAALASVLLDAETPAGVRQRARADLAARTYMPSATDAAEWAAEAIACLGELRARRARWDARATEQALERKRRGQRRRAR